MNDMALDDDMMTDDAVRARVEQLTREFEIEHPAKAAACKFVSKLFDAARIPDGAISTRSDREREAARAELHVRFGNLCDLFDAMESDLEAYIFDRLLKIMMAAHELGMHSAPDGRHGRAAKEDKADSKFIELVSAVNIYCREHGIEPKASEKFARVIRPDILELFGKPKDANAPSKIYPSLSAIVKALRVVRKSSFVL
jgi:hypothetical protein